MTTYPPPPPASGPAGAAPQKSGCLKYALIGCGVVLVLLGIGAVIMAAVVFGAIKRTDVYKGARDRAIHDPRVIAALGSPVEPGFIVSGKVSLTDGEGTASINFPVSGPKAKADVHAEATLENSKWRYTVLNVLPNNGPPIDVLKP